MGDQVQRWWSDMYGDELRKAIADVTGIPEVEIVEAYTVVHRGQAYFEVRDGRKYEIRGNGDVATWNEVAELPGKPRSDHAHVPPDEDRFTNRPPTPEQAEILDEITAVMLRVDALLTNRLPDSRYRATARTKLEECSMWAKKATVFTA